MSKQIIFDILEGKKADRVPAGFWFHFATNIRDFAKGPNNPELFNQTLEGHKQYFKEVPFDLLKIMTEGYFVFPSLKGVDITNDLQLAKVEPIDMESAWVNEQVDLARQLVEEVEDKAAVYYTVFPPVQYLLYSEHQYGRNSRSDEELGTIIRKNPDAFTHALSMIAKDTVRLAERLFKEAGIDGIFLAARSYETVTSEEYLSYIAPSETYILDHIIEYKDSAILHICGGFGVKNDFLLYKDYKFKIVNWAVDKDGITLKQGKEIFPGKVVLGGFSNEKDGVLLSGTKDEIQSATEKIVDENGRDNLILGADCALPSGFSEYERLSWVKEKADIL